MHPSATTGNPTAKSGSHGQKSTGGRCGFSRRPPNPADLAPNPPTHSSSSSPPASSSGGGSPLYSSFLSLFLSSSPFLFFIFSLLFQRHGELLCSIHGVARAKAIDRVEKLPCRWRRREREEKREERRRGEEEGKRGRKGEGRSHRRRRRRRMGRWIWGQICRIRPSQARSVPTADAVLAGSTKSGGGAAHCCRWMHEGGAAWLVGLRFSSCSHSVLER